MTKENRLREERERLSFSQAQFAAIGGTTRKSQIEYEQGKTQPRLSYLEGIAKVGADIQYIVTGERSEQTISADEKMLLDAYRKASPDVKLFMLQGISPLKQEIGNNSQFIMGNFNSQIKVNNGNKDE